MNEDEIQRWLESYRRDTENAAPPGALADHVVGLVPRRARARRFVRDARAGLVLAVVVAAGSGFWALRQSAETEQLLLLEVSAWTEAL